MIAGVIIGAACMVAILGWLTVRATLRTHGRPLRCIVADRSQPGTCAYHIAAQPGLELGVKEQLDRVLAQLQREQARND